MTQPSQSHSRLTIGVLYGFRALMVLFVANYHFWQQSWLMQQVTIAGKTVSFDFFTRSGYLFVDGMLLLSGFLLYLPHAQAAEGGALRFRPKAFYQKRIQRIVPSYLASILLMLLLFALPGKAYPTAGAGALDVLTHLTFTFTFFKSTYLYTPLNGVLWTIAIEVQFYLLFPLLVRLMRKHPALTLSAMAGAGIAFRLITGLLTTDLAMLVNQLPSFLDVYALGMLGAILFIRMRAWIAQPKVKTAATVLSVPLFILSIFVLLSLFRVQSASGLGDMDALRQSQWIIRLPLAVTLLMAMLSASHLPHILQKLLDNRLMRFLSVISLNLYIWHQVIAIYILRPLFPDTLHQNPAMQAAYTLLCYSLSILTAMAFTYGLEHPAAKRLQSLRINKGDDTHERRKT